MNSIKKKNCARQDMLNNGREKISPFPNKEDFDNIEDDISKSLNNPKDYLDMRVMSETTYNNLAGFIINNSINELNKSTDSKRKYKIYLTIVFSILLVIFIVLLFWLVFNEKQYDYRVLIVYIGSLMVEIILTMQMFIKLVFDNSYQTKVITILHKFLENFQKIE